MLPQEHSKINKIKQARKITVLGAGSSGCIAALHFALARKYSSLGWKIPRVEVELIHDPEISPEPVGLGTLPKVSTAIWSALNQTDWHTNPMDAVPKLGVLYEGWGNTEEAFAPLAYDYVAMHFKPSKFQEYILNSKQFDVIEANVKDYESIDSDLIVDCRGTPTDWDNYDELLNPLNTVLLGELDEQDPKQLWTRAVATPNGWTFVIPVGNSTSYGYLYNNKLTSDVDAISNFEEMFGIKETKKLSFKNYIAKNPFVNNRIALNGNRLFFIEPLEATSLMTHLDWCRMLWRSVIMNKMTTDNATNQLKKYVNEVKNFILWHYQVGSKYDTPFWNYAKTLQIDDPSFYNIIKGIESPNYGFYEKDSQAVYGQWGLHPFKMWYDRVISA